MRSKLYSLLTFLIVATITIGCKSKNTQSEESKNIIEKIVDKVICYIAPKIIGGTLAKTPIGGQGIEKLIDAINIKNMSLKSIGEDVVIEGYIEG